MRCLLSYLLVGLSVLALGGRVAAPAAAPKTAGQVWPPDPENKVVCISGIYPHLAVFNPYGECGIGAVAPWADKLWFITYPPHAPEGSQDKLYTVDSRLKLEMRPESVGGTHANRMIHPESRQLILGPHFIDEAGRVRTVDLARMPLRITGNARHLVAPADKVYFVGMERELYEVEVKTLAANRIYGLLGGPYPGSHGKGAATSAGRLVVANNGERGWRYDGDPGFDGPAGCLAETDGRDWSQAWRVIERAPFTEVAGPGGLRGVAPGDDRLWALGWDKRSVILKLREGGQWHTFRLPKGSYTQDALHGWYTEWPRIREVTEGRWLAHMHGLFYDFPPTFAAAHYGGLRALSTYTRMPVDYCAWRGQIVMARDDASIMQNELAGQSHSALWFGSWADLEGLGAPAGWGGPWLNDDLAAGAVSPPFLVAGFREGTLHLKHHSASAVDFTVEADAAGRGQWRPVAGVSVPAHGYAFRVLGRELKAGWVRVRAGQAARRASAYFHLGNPPRRPDPARFAALADADYRGPVIDGLVKPDAGDARRLILAANLYEGARVKERRGWVMDGRLEWRPLDDADKEAALRAPPGAGPALAVEAASVVVTHGGQRYRLPRTAAVYDDPFPTGWPRALREVVTERNLFNVHGTIYEVPRADAGGFQRLRPITTHHKRIRDFAAWRGLLVLTGVRAGARPDGHCHPSADGAAAVWFGEVDDLWRLGAPAGVGGPWKDTAVAANEPSDPYLMAGYRTKSLALSHRAAQPVAFTIEVDFAANGEWSRYCELVVPPGRTLKHRFPAGYSAHWVRLKTDRAARASAIFTYRP